jgi:hypothetical protein
VINTSRCGQTAAAYRHLVVAQQRQRGSCVVSQRKLTSIAGECSNRSQRRPAAQRPDHVGQLFREIGVTHQLDAILGQ